MDIKLVFEKIEKEDERIDYWNHTLLGRIAGSNMELSDRTIPKYLRKLLTTKEFYDYISTSERNETKSKDLLPLSDVDNRPLYVRLIAYSAIGTAGRSDSKYLLRLASHQYSLISRAAALKLVKLFGIDSFKMLSKKIDDAILDGNFKSLSEAIHNAEMHFYRVASVI